MSKTEGAPVPGWLTGGVGSGTGHGASAQPASTTRRADRLYDAAVGATVDSAAPGRARTGQRSRNWLRDRCSQHSRSAQAGQSQRPTRTAQPIRRSRRWWRAVVVELAHALVLLPLLTVATVLLPALPWLVPAAAEALRGLARWCGQDTPSERGEGGSATRLSVWSMERMWSAGYWRQDVPLVLSGTGVSVVSLVVGSVGLVSAGALAVTPFAASVTGVEVSAGSWSTRAESALQLWYLWLIALVLLAVTLLLLRALGWLRGQVTQALSGSREAELARSNERLRSELGQVSAGRVSLVDAFEAERARIERDLHDGAQQELVALSLSLGMARLRAQSLAQHLEEVSRPLTCASVPDEGPTTPQSGQAASPHPGGGDGTLGAGDTSAVPGHGATAEAEQACETLLTDLARAQDRAEAALAALRRTVRGIRPLVLAERGLVAALRELVSTSPLSCRLHVEPAPGAPERVSSPVETACYFAVAEALSNVAKHAGEEAEAEVSVWLGPEGVRIVVADDGVGGADPQRAGSTGLRGMRQRMESVGGSLLLDSPPGGGTRLRLSAPVAPAWA